MSRPQSYPFFRIAKEFNIEYADVLTIADFKRTLRKGTVTHKLSVAALSAMQRVQDAHPDNNATWRAVEAAVTEAVDEFILIQNGVIDWITGERINGN